jgi:hypothetical protein
MKTVFTVTISVLWSVNLFTIWFVVCITRISKLYHANHRKTNAIMPTFERIKKQLVAISIVVTGIDVILIAVDRIPLQMLNVPRVMWEYVTTTLIAAVSLCVTVTVATIF